jgi:hypothetical protein
MAIIANFLSKAFESHSSGILTCYDSNAGPQASICPFKIMQSVEWKTTLKSFTQSLSADKVSAGDVYACVGLPREKQRRRAIDSVAVRALMQDLGWSYQQRSTQPRFVKTSNCPIIAIIDQKKDIPVVATRNLDGLTDRHLHALKIIERDWEDCDRLGISAEFLAAKLGLEGKDPARVARNILQSLIDRNLVSKTLRSTQVGRVARYMPTGSTVQQISSNRATALAGQALSLFLRHKHKAFTEEDMILIVERGVRCTTQDATDAVKLLLKEFSHYFEAAHRSHDRPTLYTIKTGLDFNRTSNDASTLSTGCYVYFVQWENDPLHVKIGYSTSPIGRFTTFLTSSPHKLRVLGLIEVAAQEEELFLHSFFQEHRVSGEWFKYEGSLQEFIQQLPKDRLREKMDVVIDRHADRIVVAP